MSSKRIGKQTVLFSSPPHIIASAAVGGKKEGEGPLGGELDFISEDSYFGENSWEKAESAMLGKCFALACEKAKMPVADLHYIFSGDLLNQCTSSSFAMKDVGVPYFGLYGACSTMAESLSLAAMVIDGGFADTVCAGTGSHFCSAERQFRLPLEYGGQRSPLSQWTVTGAGMAILSSRATTGPAITNITSGKIVDVGITDSSNMGAAMAGAAFETLKQHFADTGRSPEFYDLILTGDLGRVGHDIVCELFRSEGTELGANYTDCGLLIYDLASQDVHSGGSGCGCSASVLCGHILRGFSEKRWKRVLFAATGALMSPTTCLQGESIPGICHAVSLELI